MSQDTETPLQQAEAAKDLGGVAYCDGSTRPTNPGPCGWGIHGYIYETENEHKTEMAKGNVIADQGYYPPKFLKSALPVNPIEFFDVVHNTNGTHTNNFAEVSGMLKALEVFYDRGVKTIVINCDSRYAVDGLTKWAGNWEKRGWKDAEGNTIKNVEIWKQLYAMYRKMREEGYMIAIKWVRGHNDLLGNVQADALANIASSYAIGNEEKDIVRFYKPKEYWKREVERSPLLNFERMFFNTSAELRPEGAYFQADTGVGDTLFGKRSPNSGLSVVYLKDSVQIIEDIIAYQSRLSERLNMVAMLKLDRVFDKTINRLLEEHGNHALRRSNSMKTSGDGRVRSNSLYFSDGESVSVECNPTILSLRAIDTFDYLNTLLRNYILHSQGKADEAEIKLHVHDITSEFYDVSEGKGGVKKKVLRKDLIVGSFRKDLVIEEDYEGQPRKVKTPLILGSDVLPRNNLKRIEGMDPSVYLITWRETPNSLRYATVISCEAGIGIWSNIYADKVFFMT